MGKFLGGIMSNDSIFGQLMTRLGIFVASNLLFVLFSVPIVTAGPAMCALFHVMLSVLRGRRELNPFKEFWKGFRGNFRQALIWQLITLGAALLAFLDYRFLRKMAAPGTAGEGAQALAGVMKFGVLAVLILVVLISMFLYPVMAAFRDTLPALVRNAIYFALKNPLRLIAVAAIWLVPAAVTYLHVYLQPLYAFCWFFFGFSAIVMAESSMLIRDFSKYLPPVDEFGLPREESDSSREEESGDGQQQGQSSGRKTLEDMQKLGM